MQRREILAVSALGLLAFGLRLAVAWSGRCIETDGVAYLRLADALAAGGDWSHSMFPPGYPALVAAVRGITGLPGETSALLLSAACGGLVLLPAYAFWRAVLGPAAALAAAALLAIWPLSVDLGASVLSESPSLLGIFCGLFAWQRSRSEGARSDGTGWAAAAGGCWGAVAWMRPELLAWSGIAALLLGRRRRLAAGALLVAATAVVYAPYVLALRVETGRWQLSAKADANLAFAHMVGRPDRQAAYEELADRVREGRVDASLPGPLELAHRVASNARRALDLAPRVWPPVLLVLGGVGAVLAARGRRLGDWTALALLAAAPLLLLFVKPRFFYASAAVLLGLGGLAAAHAGGLRRHLVVALCAALLLPQALAPLRRGDRDAAWRAAGLWLAERRHSGTVIDRKPFVAYYAGLPHHWPAPRPGLEGLREALASYPSALLVVDNRQFARSRPEWYAALAETPAWLEELARFRGPGGHEVRLLAGRDQAAARPAEAHDARG